MAEVLDFFFSRRGRHTTSLCDWSSDVCSSDLAYAPPSDADEEDLLDTTGENPIPAPASPVRFRVARRSEERRVGKECRCRWRPKHHEKIDIHTHIRRD